LRGFGALNVGTYHSPSRFGKTAHDTLIALFPSQKKSFDELLYFPHTRPVMQDSEERSLKLCGSSTKPTTSLSLLYPMSSTGVTKDHHGHTRPLLPRSFASLSQAEEENGQSRIYLGIHWAFDKTKGIEQGERVADYVLKHLFSLSTDAYVREVP